MRGAQRDISSVGVYFPLIPYLDFRECAPGVDVRV